MHLLVQGKKPVYRKTLKIKEKKCVLLNKGQTSPKPPCLQEDVIDSVITECLLMSSPVQGVGCTEVNTHSIPALIPSLVRVKDKRLHKHIPMICKEHCRGDEPGAEPG